MLYPSVSAYRRSGFRPRVHVVGTGPAGLSLALRLQQRGVPCLLIEAGGYESSPASQDFYRGEVIGDPYVKLQEARVRQFGGSSGHWSGWVRSLDPWDFQARAHIPYSGWPIGKADIDPYAATADEILQVKPRADDRPFTADIDAIHYRFSPPVRFGTTYRKAVEAADSIGLLLNTAVKDLMPSHGGIHSLTVADGERREHILPVEGAVCVCVGGIENSRLLLWSNARHAGGVVPYPQALGRYWMDHPLCVIADVVTFDGIEAQYRSWSPEKRYFAPSARASQTHAIGGAHIWLHDHWKHASEAKQLLYEAMCAAPGLSSRLLKMANHEVRCGAQVASEWEQLPSPHNRIELGSEPDPLGIPRVRLHWKKSETERKTALVCAQLLGKAFIERNAGRLRVRDFLVDGTPFPTSGDLVGRHHMGGTRMAESPALGVVDRDCRVFGMSNLYIGGSSVFPTSGHASPTYTIVQLALRLGDHLAGEFAHA